MAEKDDVVDGYQLVNLIARGNFCEIWEVVPEGGGDALAMKLLLPNFLDDKEQIAVLKTEAKVGKAMIHPNLMGCNAVATKKEFAYLLMEYFRSANLKAELSKDPVGTRSRFLRIVEGMCGALDFLHSKGWVHRDVKPDNILVSKGGELKLIDYSLSRKFGRFAGKPAAIQGTRTYIAPETISKKPPTPQTDLYSLGATLYEVLTGRPPFRSKNPNQLLLQHLKERPTPPDEVNPNVTNEMGLLILKLLEKKPDNRPKTASEFFAEVRSVQPFKEDEAEVQRRREEKEAKDAANDIDSARRLDSRADALREQENPSPRQPVTKNVVPPPPQQPEQIPQQVVVPAQPVQTTPPQQQPAPVVEPDTLAPADVASSSPSTSRKPQSKLHPSQMGVDDEDLELMDELPDIS